jgi:hypothetical protein
MDSWWDLGESIGLMGSDLALYRIQCPFCFEKGNFELAFHAEKKKPNSNKVLNFDTYKCGNCAGYVMVLWSSSEYSYGPRNSLHSFKVLPWPLQINSAPEHWPDDIQRYWIQAKKNILDENWDAAALMARSALQIILRENNAQGRTLKNEIDDLANKGLLPPIMKDWSDNIRELGNDAAHPRLGQDPTSAEDAKDVMKFLDFLIEYLYDLPNKIEKYRERRKE